MTEWSSTNGCLTISNPMEVIPTSVCLTTYDGGPEDFILTPLDELVEQVAADKLRVQVGRGLQAW